MLIWPIKIAHIISDKIITDLKIGDEEEFVILTLRDDFSSLALEMTNA